MARPQAVRVPRLDFELTTACDHRCSHCYNVWNAEPGERAYPRGQLPTAEHLALLERAVTQTGAEHVTITGGEPLLHEGALEIIARACELAPSVQLITNGSHITPERARKLASSGLRAAQLTLLAGDRAVHDPEKGAPGSFDATVRAIVDLQDAGVPAQICFVATRRTAPHFEAVLELAYALGVRSLSYNRMAPTGGVREEAIALLPTAAQVEANLAAAQRLAPAWRIKVATAMPIPPCLVRIARYPAVRFGFCSTGSESPNLVVDPLGNLRSCNLSCHVLGNLREQDFADIYPGRYVRAFREEIPPICRGCAYETSCNGGCKESAFALYGELAATDPFVRLATSPPDGAGEAS